MRHSHKNQTPQDEFPGKHVKVLRFYPDVELAPEGPTVAGVFSCCASRVAFSVDEAVCVCVCVCVSHGRKESEM